MRSARAVNVLQGADIAPVSVDGASFSEGLSGVVEFFFAAAADDDSSAGPQERLCDGVANAASAAGYEGYLTLQGGASQHTLGFGRQVKKSSGFGEGSGLPAQHAGQPYRGFYELAS